MAVFVIFGTSLLGTMIPILLNRTKLGSGKLFFACGKLFGAGVILATALVHMFFPATEVCTITNTYLFRVVSHVRHLIY